MDPIKEALTYDDVLLAPKYSEILPSETKVETKLSKNLSLKIPIISSAMDTVTESSMAIEIAKLGGIGVIHRNLDIKNQILEIKKVKSKNLKVGAAVGAGPLEIKRAEALLKGKIDWIVVDTGHGHTKKVAEIIKKIKPDLIFHLASSANVRQSFDFPKKTIENKALYESMFKMADNSTNNESQPLNRKEIESILNRYIDIVEK